MERIHPHLFILAPGLTAFQPSLNAQTETPKRAAERHFEIGAKLFAAEDFAAAALEF